MMNRCLGTVTYVLLTSVIVVLATLISDRYQLSPLDQQFRMASIILGSAIFVSEKIKKHKADKREAKRTSYEKRYEDLEAEHKQSKQGMSTNNEKYQPEVAKGENTPRSSHESQRNEDTKDGPGRWVDEANIARAKAPYKH